MRRCCPIATIVELVTELIEPAIQAPFELVDVEYEKVVGDYVLSIFVDKPGGITLNDTADLTEVISPLLDQIQPDPFPEQYFLEVTSPGLERPLKTKEAIAGAVGSATNTIFVLGGIFFLFSNVYQGSIQAMLAVVLSANSIAELLISVVLTTTIVPALEKVKQ